MSLSGTILISLLAWVLLGTADINSGDSLKIRSLAKGAVSGILEPKQEVIKDQAAWEKLWKEHTARRQPDSPAPTIDFTQEMVVLVTMGRKRSGGYAVEIVKVEPREGKLRITISSTEPARGSMTLQALTAPFHFVAVPTSPLEPEFVTAKPAP